MNGNFRLEAKVLINAFLLICLIGVLAYANVIALATNLNIAYAVGIVTGAIVSHVLKLMFKSIKEEFDRVPCDRSKKHIEL